MTTTDWKMATVYAIVILLPLGLIVGCSERDKCAMNSDKLGISASACEDPDIAAKAVKVLEQRAKNANSDASKKLDGMLGKADPTACAGRMADLAIKRKQSLDHCISKVVHLESE